MQAAWRPARSQVEIGESSHLREIPRDFASGSCVFERREIATTSKHSIVRGLSTKYPLQACNSLDVVAHRRIRGQPPVHTMSVCDGQAAYHRVALMRMAE